tara:strand:- start:3784 stop:5550 length:1767 start_codon:yes stop_codon:yes gene_type:complete
MKRKLRAYEPRINPDTKEMEVGGLKIPVTNTVTALLYGFAKNKNKKAKEYYFWRLCDEFWNRDDLPEHMMVRHPWAEEMIRAVIENKYVSIGGAANSGKSHTMAAWAIVNWLSAPRDTLVLITSTTLREARKRIWGSIISLLTVVEGAPMKVRDSIGNVAYINENGNLIERAGLSLIASANAKDALSKFIGIKQKSVILVGDELSDLSEKILHAGLSNLSKNPSFQLIGMSNPNSRFDAFGVWSEPLNGWSSINPDTDDRWVTKWGGTYIRFDGERSPNILSGEVKYPWLPTEEKLSEDRSLLGAESRGYMRMVRAIFFDSDETEGIYSEAELSRSGAMNEVDWAGKPIPVAGLDPAFTNGGDRSILYTGKVGYDQTGQYVCELGEALHLNDDATNKAVPRTYQIVRQVKEACEKRGILPQDVAVDATGAGAPFCDVLAGEWSDQILRVSFGGKASDRRVSANSKLTGQEMYMNRVSELWFCGKELVRTKQLFGIDNALAKEITARNYEMVKSGTLRVKIESKVDYKSRFGHSPDLADAAFLCLDLARQRHNLVAVEPAEGDNAKMPRQRRTIKSLTNVLASDNLSVD